MRYAPMSALLALAMICVHPALADDAATPVTITPNLESPGTEIPADFSGASIETKSILRDAKGNCQFSGSNQRLIAMFKLLGIRSLRVGGNTVDYPDVKIPDETEIDSLYAFAKAADLHVIYSVRLKGETDPAPDALIAAYIMQHYADLTTCLTIGNEPNVYFKQYPEYRAQYQKFAAAILAKVPDVQFCGPSATPGKSAWAGDFAKDIGTGGTHLKLISQHLYPGGNAEKMTDAAAGREHILSTEMIKSYQKSYDSFVPAAMAAKLPYRIEEANSVFHGGAKDISNSFASALWGLDFMYWWAEHGASGINFHTGVRTATDDTQIPGGYDLFWDSPSGFKTHPMGYAVKAFDLGSHGRIVPVTIGAAPADMNLTAYAVVSSTHELFVTIINKENGKSARDAEITLNLGPGSRHCRAITLRSPKNDIADLINTTLGDHSIAPDATWAGEWTDVPGLTLNVPASSATIVRCGL
jgi:hypothetical protein